VRFKQNKTRGGEIELFTNLKLKENFNKKKIIIFINLLFNINQKLFKLFNN
jgi:hypothetical protein